MRTLQEVQAKIKEEYESLEWRGWYDGSTSEATEDGELLGKIEMLHKIGIFSGLTLVDMPPECGFDQLPEGKIWNGKDGLIDDPDYEP